MSRKIIALILLIALSSFNIPLAYGMTEESSENLIYEDVVSEEERRVEYERQMQEIINEIEPQDEYRYYYEHQYGSKKVVTVKGFLAGQPRDGLHFPSGGGFYISKSGGANYSVSVSFPKPFDSVTISADIGCVNDSVAGYYIPAPNTRDDFKAYGEKDFEVQPFIVWKIDRYSGKKTKYYSSYLQTYIHGRYYAKKV